MPRKTGENKKDRTGLLFGTVGAPLGTPKKPGGSPGAIEYIAELGLGTLELGWVQSVRVSDATCEIIRAASVTYGIPLSVHAPYFINLNAQTSELLRGSRERLVSAARAGYKAGATDIIFHPGGYMKSSPAEAYETIRLRLAEIVQQLREEHIDVTLRPETMGKSALFGTLEECVQLSVDIPGVLPCIDFAHLHARRGDGSFNSYTEFSKALAYVKKHLGTQGIRTLHIHLSGIAYSAKGERHHLPLEEADLRYEELFQALVDAGARGRVLCESPIMEHDAARMKKSYEKSKKRED